MLCHDKGARDWAQLRWVQANPTFPPNVPWRYNTLWQAAGDIRLPRIAILSTKVDTLVRDLQNG